MAPEGPRPPHVVMVDLLTSYWKAQSVYAAAKLGLADLLKDGPQRPEALAAATGTHPRALFRLLRALASLGIFAEQPDGRFAATPLGDCLRGDLPTSQKALAI